MIELDLSKIEAIGDKLIRLDSRSINSVAVRGLNAVVNRGLDQSRRLMLAGVNLSDQYVKDRMDIEEATENKPIAKIIAFVPGGKGRPAIRSVNLRQYLPQSTLTPNNWRNTGVARNSGKKVFTPALEGANGKVPLYGNPRKAGGLLPFRPRTGNKMLNVPVGQKVRSISVEVVKGRRKLLKPVRGFAAFMQRMPNGELLVMRRVDKSGGKAGKGKIEALYSLSVAQLFKFAKSKVIPIILDDLEATVSDELIEEFQRVVNL